MSSLAPEAHIATIQWISNEYFGLNGTHYDTLEAPPSPLEFGRICRISRPVLIKGHRIPGVDRWTDEYLQHVMGDRSVSVALTPNGYADAVTPGPDGRLYFAEPAVEQMSMGCLLSKLACDARVSAKLSEVLYLQSQNGNLYSSSYFDSTEDELPELAPLRQDVPPDISWCTEALDRHPDAVNLWVGNDLSVTSIHSDPYENIYHVVRGCKVFTLLPPSEGWCLRERLYPHAKYARPHPGAPLVVQPTPGADPIRWSSILHPDHDDTLPAVAHPITITVRAGESMYLPAGWWHHVRQEGGITIALNWWYDVEMQGMTWTWLSLLRGPEDVPSGNTEADEENL
ncbi:cupin-like domain-containing protein [Vararia minispora EC-137]|uniref:Cupin-like domain-containing protein n=1 Tax=Vararia minispora EC-137 TaxID=1314806 RepID=A0ACB8QZ71_9AGAM|nr:cupin-like domain-containing protein [Vararia minispora EC-137]